MNKKKIRKNFKESVFKRDNYSCKICDAKYNKENAEQFLDAHHIIDRNEIVSGGYVKENGISLCKTGENCHLKAEQFHITGTSVPGFSPDELYAKISSSKEMAVKAAEKL